MLKTIGKVLLGLVAVVVVVAAGLVSKASVALSRTRDVPLGSTPAVRTDSATIARGEYVVRTILHCVDCHAPDLGGRVKFVDAGPVMMVHSSNLTTGDGGVLARYDDAALARAIRHGVKVDGSPILIMPAFVSLSNADLAAIIAYVRSIPPVNRQIPSSSVKPFGRLLFGAGILPLVEGDLVDHAAVPAADMVAAPTVEYGRYLANVGGCTGCHGPGLSGGKIPGTPPDWKPATNITPEGLKGWSEGDFVTALKTGVRPDRTPIDTIMPWRLIGQMDSTDLRAVWRFLQSVPPKPFGGR